MSPAQGVSEVRSRNMSAIRAKNTRPEVTIRSTLHRRGFRFLLHDARLPGKPDIVFPKYKAVILIHGCFWHGHGCPLFQWPETRAAFWRNKINSNVLRDRKHRLALLEAGWRIGTVWECAIKGRNRFPIEEVADRCADWLMSMEGELEVSGNDTQPAA